MIVIVMGVSGSGKTTVGKLIAERLGWRFEDADDYHSAENKAKMRSGHPLNDQDREPWLGSLRAMIEDRLEKDQPTIVACSALKNVYREKLIPAGVAGARGGTVPSNESTPSDKLTEGKRRVIFLYLKASFDEIASRLAHRKHEFMNPDLLKSQFQTLEEPMDTQLSRQPAGQRDRGRQPDLTQPEMTETIVVDTDGLTTKQVADEAIRRLQQS